MFQKTLFLYFVRLYTERFGAVLAIVSAALLISNIFDTLNRYRSTKFTLGIFLNIISFKIPYLLVEVLPIISFIATIVFIEYLIRSHELISVFNIGTSIWRVISSVMASLLIIGFVSTVLFQPLGAVLLNNYDRLESKILKKRTDSMMISDSGVMIAEDYQSDKRFILAKGVDVKENRLRNITIFITDADNHFIKRIEGEYAILVDSEITIYNVKVFSGVVPEKIDKITMPTNLTTNIFLESLIKPEAISFWEFLPKISRLKDAGVPFIKYQMHYYKILFKSLMMCAFSLLAFALASISNDRVRSLKRSFMSIIISFAVYLVNEVCVSIFIHNGIDPMVSILFPIFLMIFLSIFTILHLHESR